MDDTGTDLCELRLKPYHEALLRENEIFTIEEAIKVDFNWLASNKRIGPRLADEIMDNVDRRYPIWQEKGMEYKGVPGVPDEPSPEEIAARAKEAREMTSDDYFRIYGHRKSGRNDPGN